MAEVVDFCAQTLLQSAILAHGNVLLRHYCAAKLWKYFNIREKFGNSFAQQTTTGARDADVVHSTYAPRHPEAHFALTECKSGAQRTAYAMGVHVVYLICRVQCN